MKKNDALHSIVVLETKLIKLEISPARIDRIKNSVLLSQFMPLKNQVELKNSILIIKA